VFRTVKWEEIWLIMQTDWRIQKDDRRAWWCPEGRPKLDTKRQVLSFGSKMWRAGSYNNRAISNIAIPVLA
jgi:hypothetical protein